MTDEFPHTQLFIPCTNTIDVLVVDDYPAVADMVCRTLEAVGCDVWLADSGEPARRRDRDPTRLDGHGGNRNDVTQLVPLVERVPPVRGQVGRPRRRPDPSPLTAATTTTSTAAQLWQRGIKPEIARRQTKHGSGLGRARWVVERTFAWLHQFKRLLVRYDRRADIHEAFLAIGAALSA